MLIFAQGVICIVVTVPIFVIPVDFVNTAAMKIVSVKMECALKTLIMKTTFALIAVNASALHTNATPVIIMGNIVVQAAVIWL